jgi:hypothetical protein
MRVANDKPLSFVIKGRGFLCCLQEKNNKEDLGMSLKIANTLVNLWVLLSDEMGIGHFTAG